MARKPPPPDPPATASPPDPEPPSPTKQFWARLLGPGRIIVHPELNAVVKEGETLAPDRAKQIAREVADEMQHELPRASALAEVVRAVDDLLKTWLHAYKTVQRIDAILLPLPERHLTPRHELGRRATRLLRKAVEERERQDDPDTLVTAEALQKLAPEMFMRARTEMVALGHEQPGPGIENELQDVIPMGLLRLQQVLLIVGQILKSVDEVNAVFKTQFEVDAFPYSPTGGRAPMAVAMLIAWILQDAVERGMPDHHVVRFLEDAWSKLPADLQAKQIPKPRAVAEWRREREKIPGICPRRDRATDEKPPRKKKIYIKPK